MSQYDFGTINAGTKSGSALAADLNAWRNAVNSSHKGSSAPSYAVAGLHWIDDTGDPIWLHKRYDGTNWIVVEVIDATANIAYPATVSPRQSFPLAGGTANALTLTPAVSLTAYADADVLTFEASADNTGAATLNVSGVGVKAIRKVVAGADVALAVGDIRDGNRYFLNYDTAANATAGAWVLVNPTVLIAVPPYTRIITTSGTWTKPAGLAYITVEVWGGGGAGQKTIGAGGGGATGGTSSFGSHCSATGGTGGSGGSGGPAGSGSGGDINLVGGAGGSIDASQFGGTGGSAPFGGGGGRGSAGNAPGGGGSTSSGSLGAGGSGGYSRKTILAASLGSTETVTIGAGGAADTSGYGGARGQVTVTEYSR